MAYTIEEKITLETIRCGECGITFAVPDWWKRARSIHKENGGAFYCPNGHCRVFSETELDRVKRERDEAMRKLTSAKCETAAERVAREKAESELKRHQKRTRNGVCPCCNRSFVNLQRHMTSKHPTFAKA